MLFGYSSMTQIAGQDDRKKPSLPRAILTAGLLAGTLDITAASVQTLINGRSPVAMLKFVASGVFGAASLTGGTAFAFYGLFFHYCIAMAWTVVFFLIYPKFTFLSRNRVVTGIGYGLFVWLAMSQVVLPLSNTPAFPFRISGAIIAALILMVAIGLPLSFMAHKFYSSRKTIG